MTATALLTRSIPSPPPPPSGAPKAQMRPALTQKHSAANYSFASSVYARAPRFSNTLNVQPAWCPDLLDLRVQGFRLRDGNLYFLNH